MDCRIIFYSAKKTSYCEKAIRKCTSGLGLNISYASFATNNYSLGSQLIEGFEECDFVFVVGGLDFDDSRSVKKITESAVSDLDIDFCKKLKNESGEDGYILRAGNQILILLPDYPEQIEAVLQGCVSDYIRSAIQK